MTHSLRDTIRQQQPFRSAEQEAFLNVLRTAAELTDGMERALRPAGLSVAQYNVLRILRGAEPEGLCRNDLRDRLITRMPDVTRLLDRMEAAGLVSRARDGRDRRMVTTRITARGRAAVDGLDDVVEAEHRRRLGHLGAAQLRKLIDLLGRVREGAA
jgi:DNA-binding MarR family transcriptional regulator